MQMRSDLMAHRHKSHLLTLLLFFCQIDSVIHTKLPFFGKLENCPSDSIDVNCNCCGGGSSNVEERIIKILEPCIGRVFDQFHRSRHPTGQVSIVVLEEYAVKLSSAVLLPSNSISGQNTVLNTCIMTVPPLKVCNLCACCKAFPSSTLLKDKPNKWDKAVEQNQLNIIYITCSHSNALCLMGSVQELPLMSFALLFSQLGIRSHA